MRKFLKKILFISIFLFLLSIIPIYVFSQDENSNTSNNNNNNNDTSNKILSIKTINITNLKTGYGAKSILISPDSRYVFSINLEAMNLYIFDRETKKLKYKLQFIAHPGKGYNYSTHKWINSYQEKPVEGYFTHGGRFLWVSLHNAGGIVLIDLLKLGLFKPEDYNGTNSNDKNTTNSSNNNKTSNNADTNNSTSNTTKTDSENNNNNNNKTETNFSKIIDTSYNFNKQAYFYDLENNKKIKISLPFFKTGTTPKIISSTSDDRYLFISNWHSATVSVFDISSNKVSNFKKIKDIKSARIPRGLAVSKDNKKLYIADMGSNIIYIISIPEFKKIGYIKVPVNPRHLIIDGNYMYASININSQIVKIDLNTNKIVLKNNTKKSARTIALSKDKKIVFVTCYRGEYVQAFSTQSLKLIGEWKSSKGPVGIDVFQQKNLIQAWVVNYSTGIIKVIEIEEQQ